MSKRWTLQLLAFLDIDENIQKVVKKSNKNFDPFFVSPALAGNTHRDHFVHCCFLLLLSVVVVKTG